jgi:NAD(P)-dependent dehydrogenase (short-subunit alcohol dehydrogenase family)
MDVRDAVVVVTGAAGGIGSALARRFAAEGARGVVVADLDGDRAKAVAEGIGPAALGLACDATDEAALARLLTAAEDRFGPVNLFCANAGIAVGTDLEDTPEEVWDQALDVNLRAHVRAARLLVPGWLERGSGYFLSTASAAGLLSQIGSGPYAVSKHAAVAFAEWLAITYGDRGVRVSCLCPMGVDTPLLRGGQGRPALEGAAAASVTASGPVLSPDEVAGAVIAGLQEERFLILPHPEVHDHLVRKATDPDRWLAGMRRFQSRLLS